MSIEIEKPAPLMVGDKAYYNLTSYDPVVVEVEVPYVSDPDIDLALAALLQEMGGTPASLNDRAWMAEHFDGVTDVAQLRLEVREQLSQMNEAMAEEQKSTKCMEELTKRLRQKVPQAHVSRAREGVQFAFEQQLTVDGLTVDQFLARSRMRPDDLSAMLDAQARQACEQNAALDAYAREKKLTVDEAEIGPLLGIPAENVGDVISQMRAAGQYDQMHDAALHAKAAQAVINECVCTYRHETPEQARARSWQLEELRRQLENGGMPGGLSSMAGGGSGSSNGGDKPKPTDNPAGLHLV